MDRLIDVLSIYIENIIDGKALFEELGIQEQNYNKNLYKIM